MRKRERDRERDAKNKTHKIRKGSRFPGDIDMEWSVWGLGERIEVLERYRTD